MKERDLELTPPPQGAPHADQSPQWETTQSMGQSWALQCWVSSRAPQGAPPWSALTTTLRERDWLPLPQLRVHAFHGPQSEVTQSCRQGCVLQACDSSRAGQT